MKERTTHDDIAMKKQFVDTRYVCMYSTYVCKAKSMCVVLQIAEMPIGEV